MVLLFYFYQRKLLCISYYKIIICVCGVEVAVLQHVRAQNFTERDSFLYKIEWYIFLIAKAEEMQQNKRKYNVESTDIVFMGGKMKQHIFLASPHMSEEGYEQAYIREAFETNWIDRCSQPFPALASFGLLFRTL